MFFLQLIVLMALLFLPVSSQAEPVESQGAEVGDLQIGKGPSLSDLVDHAFRANPAIDAARHGWKAAVERLRVVTALPDPELSSRYLTDTVGDRGNPRNIEYNLTQAIPFPGKLGKDGKAAEADIKIARLEYDRVARNTTVQVRESFYELTYIRAARRIAEGNKEILSRINALADSAYAANRATFIDIGKAQAQTTQLQYDILLLEELEAAEIARLNALLDRPPGAIIGPLDPEPLRPLSLELDAIYQKAEENQEEIKQAGARVEKAEAQEGRAMLGYLPDFSIGVYIADTAIRATADEPNPDNKGFGILAGMTIPLWIDKNIGQVEAARAEAAQARAERKSRVNDTRAEIRGVYFKLRNAERLVELYKNTLMPQATKAMETAESWYRLGQGSLTDYVETQSVWYNFQLAQARAKADHGRALARLEQLVGKSLEREASPLATSAKGEP